MSSEMGGRPGHPLVASPLSAFCLYSPRGGLHGSTDSARVLARALVRWHRVGVVSGVLIFLGTWRGNAIARRIETEAPFQQPLAQASAKVILQGATLYEIDAPARIANKGGSLRLVGEHGELLVLTSLETLKSPSSEGIAVYYELDMSLNPSSASRDRPIGELLHARTGQIIVSTLPENARVFGGEVSLVLNNSISVVLPIDEQTATGRVVLLEDLEPLHERLRAE